MSKLLWAIAKKADTLWIRWIHTYVLKGKCMWSIVVPPSASWTIRKFFGLRKLVQTWIRSVIGDGQDTFLWLDNCHPLGPLKDRFEGRLTGNLVRTFQLKVASIISNNSWMWPGRRNLVVKEIMDSIPISMNPHIEVKYFVMWTLNRKGTFSIQSAWQGFRKHHSEVLWWKSVWFKIHVPGWAIIQWIAAWGM